MSESLEHSGFRCLRNHDSEAPMTVEQMRVESALAVLAALEIDSDSFMG
jgi:hypothetical protein